LPVLTRNALAPATALLFAALLGVGAWSWRTAAIGGSDSACYALMARVFAEGAWQPFSPIAEGAPWPDASRVAAPGGFLPSAIRAGAAVPVCAPGYALLLAPLVAALGLDAVHLVPPAAAASLVWLAFLLARRLSTPLAGVAAAGLTASTPIVLFQAVQPMNDIATGTLWLAVALATCLARPTITGALVGVALLVRPNLALGGAVAILAMTWLRANPWQPGWAHRVAGALAASALAAAPGVIAVLVLNHALYGSPFRSGYGDLGVLFSAAHIPVNLAHYGTSWVRSGSPMVLLAGAAWWSGRAERRRETTAVVLLAVALAVVYLAYRPFDEWWYLRFLLPSVALAAVLAAVTLTGLAQRASPKRAGLVVALIVVVVGGYTLRTPYARDARGLRVLEARFPDTAAVVATRLDPGAVAIAIWHSGGLRFWPGRDVMVWDALDPQWLDHAVSWLQVHGRQPVIVVERWEEAAFRRRFAGQVFGGLDWPPRYDVDRRVRLFLPEDREPYFRGGGVATEAVFGPRWLR
jgi:hypothetical protein